MFASTALPSGRLQPGGFERLARVVVVVEPDDLVVAQLVQNRVAALDLGATPTSFGPHAEDGDDAIARVDELLGLKRPLRPGGAPLLEPAGNAFTTAVLAALRDVVVMDLDLFIDRVQIRLARADALESASDELDVALRHRLCSLPHPAILTAGA